MDFTLKINGGAAATLAALGVENAQLEFFSRDTDTCTLDQAVAAFTAAPLFAYGDTVDIFNPAGTRVFSGQVRDITAIGEGAKQAMQFKILGPWDWLKHCVYQQQANFATTPTSPTSALALHYISEVILGTDYAGNFKTVGVTLTEIFSQAYTLYGAPFGISGALFSDGTDFPSEQTSDLTLDDAIKRVLRYIPDALSYVDYSTTPPTIVLQRAGAMSTKSLAIPTATANPDNLLGVPSVRPRYDLIVPAVVLRYIGAGGPTDNGWNVLATDIYPGGASGFVYNTLVCNLRLKPGKPAVTLEQTTVTTPLPGALNCGATVAGAVNSTAGLVITVGVPATQAAAIAWLKLHDPSFVQSNITNLKVANLKIQALDGTSIGIDDYSFELVDGAYSQWIYDTYSIASQKRQFYIDATWTDTTDSSPRCGTFGPFTYLATNAAGTTYRLTTTPAVIAESPPSGLAAVIYSGLEVLRWSGSVRLGEGEWSGSLRPGLILSFTGGRAAWTTLGALVQNVSVNLKTGESVATFGPPEHLGAQDLIELLRLGRDRRASVNLDSRVLGTDGSPADNAVMPIDFPEKPKQHVAPHADGAVATADYTGPTDGSVVLVAAMRQWQIGCDDSGKPWFIKIISTQKYQTPT